MKIKLLACPLLICSLALTGCGFARSSTLRSSPTEVDPDLVVRYLHARADFIEKTGKMQQPLNDLVNEMVSDCKAKKLGESITLNGNGLPMCFKAPAAATPPATKK
jgi:hypothetical protein